MGGIGAFDGNFTLPDFGVPDFSLEGFLELVGIDPASGERDAVVLDYQSSPGSRNLKPVGTRFIGYGGNVSADVAVGILHECKDIILDLDIAVLAVVDRGFHT